MQALTFHGKQTISYETVADPGIEQPTDAIVKVSQCSICGSDMHPYHEREKGLDHGTVMGHEFVGEVVEVGSSVKALKTGTQVMSPFTISCGNCFYCHEGLTARCVNSQLYGWRQSGSGLHGGQAELVRVPLADSTLLTIPDGVSSEEAILLGDIFSTGYFCAANAGVNPGGTYAVLGCGPVGIMAIIGARELGAEKIFAIDSVPGRLSLAEKFGATAINFPRTNPRSIIDEETAGRGVDAVLEVVGSAAAGRSAYELVRPGGTISTVGVHTESQMAFSPVEAYDKNITYKIGRCPARYYMEKLIPIVQKKKYDLASVFSHKMLLKDGAEAYRIFDKKQDGCMKVLLEI